MGTTIYTAKYFEVIIPDKPHITRRDGGHLEIRPLRKVVDRTKLTIKEAHEFVELTMIFGEAMAKGMRKRGVPIGRINYQDNGNWGIFSKEGPHMSLHLYGRATNSKFQKYGEALSFMPKGSRFYEKTEKINNGDVKEILRIAEGIMKRAKFRKGK